MCNDGDDVETTRPPFPTQGVPLSSLLKETSTSLLSDSWGPILRRDLAGWCADPTSDLAVADGSFSQQLGGPVIRVAPTTFEGFEWGKNGGGKWHGDER